MKPITVEEAQAFCADHAFGAVVLFGFGPERSEVATFATGPERKGWAVQLRDEMCKAVGITANGPPNQSFEMVATPEARLAQAIKLLKEWKEINHNRPFLKAETQQFIDDWAAETRIKP